MAHDIPPKPNLRIRISVTVPLQFTPRGSDGAAVLAPAVRASVDGALLVARGMVTTRAEVADCSAQLQVLGLQMIGGVWNDSDCVPPAETLRSFREGLRSWPPQLPPGVLPRQFRWWS